MKALVLSYPSSEIIQFLVLIYLDSYGKEQARLPLLSEIKKEVLAQSTIHKDKEIVLVNTPTEVSPWDLLEPFPPADYYDYGYVQLPDFIGECYVDDSVTKQKRVLYKMWDILPTDEKQLLISLLNKEEFDIHES